MAAMGIGNVGNPGVIFKRKFRYTIEIRTPVGTVPVHYVKVAARPKLEIDETEINFLNAVSWIPGKARWQPINVVWRDVAASDVGNLYSWVTALYNFQDTVGLAQNEKAGWAAVAELNLYDGCGNKLETWLLGSVFPTMVDFGDLDYESTDEVTVDLTLRYSEVEYTNHCGTDPAAGCRGCEQEEL